MVVSREVINLDEKYLLDLVNWQLNPGFKQPGLHKHHTLEISCVKQGTGSYHVENRIYDVRENDVFVFNNIEVHRLHVDETNTMVNMVIQFEPWFIWSVDNHLFDMHYLDVFFNRGPGFENRLDRNNPATIQIRNLLLEIEEEFLDKATEYERMIKVKLLNILVLLARHYGYINPKQNGDNVLSRQKSFSMNKVMDYIDENLGKAMCLEELSSIAHMSPAYFSSLFKKYNGINLTEYISRKRIYSAIEYLKATDKTILEIAHLCGFNNSTNFNKAFRKITNKTPSDFRNGFKQLI